MARAALDLGCPPRWLSFMGALQAVRAFAERLLTATAAALAELHTWLLIVIGSHQVADRPDRVEPRARKRRPKDYPHLHCSRDEARTFRNAKT